MKVAFLFNLNRRQNAYEAEFELPSTVAELTQALSRAHTVRQIECVKNVSDWLPDLIAFGPDLAFSVAEGYHSAVREAFYPALYEQLGIRYVGSDPTTHLFSQNKALGKAIAQSAGVLIAPGVAVAAASDLERCAEVVSYPAIVKPNSEGSSIGIDANAIVRNDSELRRRVEYVWRHLENIALVEQYIVGGVDLSMTYVEGLGTEIFGPVGYDIPGADLYDYERKANSYLNPKIVRVPEGLTTTVTEYAQDATRKLVTAFDLRGYGRVDFRVDPTGRCFFLEMNAQVEMSEKGEFSDPVLRAGYSYEDMVLHIADTAVSRAKQLPSSVGISPKMAFLFDRAEPVKAIARPVGY